MPHPLGSRLALLLSVSALATSCASEPLSEPHVIAEIHQGIAGGQRDTLHTNVFGIFNQTQGGICTGTLIAPNLLLTAQHCVAENASAFVICGSTTFGDVYPASGFLLSAETQLSPFGNSYGAVEVLVPEESRDLCNTDIALIILDTNVPSSVAEPAIPRIDITAQQGEVYSAHGYGDTNGTGGSAGQRRWLTDRQVFCDGDACRAFGGNQIQSREWVGSDGTCQGDSGGPALDSEGRVFGVLSRGGDGCSSSVYSAVDDWSDWIRATAERAAELGGYDPAPWVRSGNSDPNFVDDDADGISDDEDNCVDVANPDQLNEDRDALGDACDDRDDRDRGGICDVCNSCIDDSECPRGSCVDFGEGGVCTFDCDSNSDCPVTSTCFSIPTGGASDRGLCLNENSAEAGVCEESYVCGGAIADNPDAFACDVCEACTEDSQCNGGLCLNFGTGSICTATCENTECPGNTECFEVDGMSVCLNGDAGEAGVCPASFICGDADALEEASGTIVATTSTDKGCSASSTTPRAGLWLVFGALFAVRRRRA